MKLRNSVFTAASPNTQWDDALLAFAQLATPWNYRREVFVERFMQNFASYVGVNSAVAVDSGRSALQIIIESLGLQNSEIITPSFTCVVVPDAVVWGSAKPIYLDTNIKDFNPDYSTLQQKITPQTKAIIIQHTFGKMVNVAEIRNMLDQTGRRDVLLIEDFAHTLKRNMQIEGDVGFCTFGIEKVISSVRGGAIITNNDEIARLVSQKVATLPQMPTRKIITALLNPIFWWFAIPLHSVGFGRFSVGALVRTIWRKLGFLGIMVEKSENYAVKPDWFPARMPGSLARLGQRQLEKLERFNIHRTKISKIYHNHLAQVSDSESFDEERVYLRYPILLRTEDEKQQVWNLARGIKVTLGNWFAIPLYGSMVSAETYEKLSFNPDEFPITNQKCAKVLNLTTSINMSEDRAAELAFKIKNLLNPPSQTEVEDSFTDEV